MDNMAPRPSVRAQSRLTGPFKGQSSEWPLTDDINPKSTSSKITQTQAQAQAQAQHTHTHHRNAQAQSLPLSPPFPLFAIASCRHSRPQIPDPSLLPRRPLIITGQQANTSRISSITLSESGHYLRPR